MEGGVSMYEFHGDSLEHGCQSAPPINSLLPGMDTLNQREGRT